MAEIQGEFGDLRDGQPDDPRQLDRLGTLLADRQGRWDRSLLETLGLPDRLLAPHFASHEAAGTLTASLAAAWGLPAGIPVAAGGGDTPVAALGSGLLLDGSAQLTTGSGAQIVVLRHTLPAPSAKLNCYRTAAPPKLPRWYTMAAMQNAGVALEWARRTLGLDWPAAWMEPAPPEAREREARVVAA